MNSNPAWPLAPAGPPYPTVLVEDDGITPLFYTYETMKEQGMVRTRQHLSDMIHREGHPGPIKSSTAMQAKATYHGPSVRWFHRQRALYAGGQLSGRPRKNPVREEQQAPQ
jgi:hypothetical protein